MSSEYIKPRCKSLPALLIWAACLPVSFLWSEGVFRLFVFGNLSLSFLTFVLPFSLAFGGIFTVVLSFLPPKGERIAGRIVLGGFALLYSVHYVYYRFFQAFYAWEMISNGEALTDFWRETLMTALKNSYVLLLLWVPFILYCVFCRKIAGGLRAPILAKIITGGSVLVLFALCFGQILIDREPYGKYYYHTAGFTVSEGIDRFGITDATLTDLRFCLFGRPEESTDLDRFLDETTVNPDDIFVWNEETTIDAQSTAEQTTDEVTEPTESTTSDDTQQSTEPVYPSENKLNIDFDALLQGESDATIAEMHRYFSSLEATPTNEYTGMFAGKNLITITAEAFCPQFITEELTPTLYRMLNQGVVLENFYNSAWGGSTATGEYANTTGLFYYYGLSPGAGQVWNCVSQYQDYLPFTLGNELKAEGYITYGFHNHNYQYYGRSGSHPLLGYTWIARGNGLDNLTSTWPCSDVQMAEQTLSYYIDSEQPFHVYYMTISGHGYYGWENNAMSRKNKSRVASLNYSEEVKSYIACQLEFEDMLTLLVEKLEEKGILEDTVFMISADHYPYSLSVEAQKELYGLQDTKNIEAEFELYRNAGIIWCASMEEPIHVTSPCSAIDLLPTLLNLFGLPYDSRLLMGTDVLSGVEPLVILNQNGKGTSWNWINRYGSYSSATKTFTPAEGVTVDQSQLNAYVNKINTVIALKRRYAPQILYKNYYNCFRDVIDQAHEELNYGK